MQHFDVKGMTCGHCVRAVTETLLNADPQAKVAVDLEKSLVSVESALAPDAIIGLIGVEGYAAKALP